MKITVIVAKTHDGEMPWVVGAWDEYCMDANYQGYLDALEEHIKKNAGSELRTAEIEVPEGFLESIYRPIKVKARIVGSEGVDDVGLQGPTSERFEVKSRVIGPEGVHGGGPARGKDGETKGQDGGLS